jgi:hypothetical protein
MGLTVDIYRNPLGDCTNGGISSKVKKLCVINVDGPCEPSEDCPAVVLKNHVPGCLRLVPPDHDKKWYQFGGNYGATSDSRFTEACEKLLGRRFYGAVAIHDRTE